MFKKCSKVYCCTLGGFNFIRTVYKLLMTSRTCIYANPHLLCTILERDMMVFFPNFVKNVRIQALSDSVKFSRRLMQKILELLNCELPTPKDQSYRAESE